MTESGLRKCKTCGAGDWSLDERDGGVRGRRERDLSDSAALVGLVGVK